MPFHASNVEKVNKVGAIYHIPCAGINSTLCEGRYVGETERTATPRFNEHTSTSFNALGKYKSAMLQHAREHGHHFRRQDVTFLDHEDWVRRGIKESLYIRVLAPSINIHSVSIEVAPLNQEVCNVHCCCSKVQKNISGVCKPRS